ncbi:spore germination protein [Alkalihalophilus lindianensis]|uniref:Spore germination protein n=2 Tax=Alkalihalophilus lindianensis TaxID=1630542 RepID=A0ABU3X6B8_9BACI|nr:spore germination protein [Alkalihalophilus lindianensis]MDV2683409.1 spore germination protein [Alkalihalophilus lindianensis]
MMLVKWMKQRKQKQPSETIEDIYLIFDKSSDYSKYKRKLNDKEFEISYFQTMIDIDRLHRDVLPYLTEAETSDLDSMIELVPIQNKMITTKPQDLRNKVMEGFIAIRDLEDLSTVALIEAGLASDREVTTPEVEFSVAGPQESFIESIDTNINLIRKRLPLPQLQIKEFTLGKITKTRVAVLYVEGLVDQENFDTMIQRLQDLEFDQILDSSSLAQMITDKTMSIFPQLINTERPERVSAVLAEGKVAFLCDGSPESVFGPVTLVEFFSSLEDYYLPWQIASSVRLLRFFSVAFSILATPIYVAVLTYHYELIPKDLLATVMASRSNIPFPPVIEAVFLELTIELLREAGARLPTKVGQTIGIVGGIVIGQASVEAGLTSNVLLIIVALAALASFTTPVYQMGNTIRLIRFPFILSAALFGGIGIAFCGLYTLAHLLHLTSLGRPYLEPIFPPRVRDWRDAFIRMPFRYMSTRPVYLRPRDKGRFNFFRAKEKHDIDE